MRQSTIVPPVFYDFHMKSEYNHFLWIIVLCEWIYSIDWAMKAILSKWLSEEIEYVSSKYIFSCLIELSEVYCFNTKMANFPVQLFIQFSVTLRRGSFTSHWVGSEMNIWITFYWIWMDQVTRLCRPLSLQSVYLCTIVQNYCREDNFDIFNWPGDKKVIQCCQQFLTSAIKLWKNFIWKR